jgi:hypothetical protein
MSEDKFKVGNVYEYTTPNDEFNIILIFRIERIVNGDYHFEQLYPVLELQPFITFDRFHVWSDMYTRSKLHIPSEIKKDVDDFLK